ncbi:MAG TPA: hypothetical protein DCY95_21470 [Algoriphagus sp.]|jgi:hypothetical protein|nr:hypothetical protein [Algoriphagus sp.]HAS59544.1 hypothetical protein [Algoriphagus sp.]HAZ26817.1 hypothetical protein [Algoriphagus sp.]HCH45247.1 hypothetical protein [Algoriphagus sp.]|tara:strand:+ start:491 stop:688 length:198 start_codon:yes stop_codon:yes gene_type:complete
MEIIYPKYPTGKAHILNQIGLPLCGVKTNPKRFANTKINSREIMYQRIYSSYNFCKTCIKIFQKI